MTEPTTLSPAEFKTLVANEVTRWCSVAQKARIVAEWAVAHQSTRYVE